MLKDASPLCSPVTNSILTKQSHLHHIEGNSGAFLLRTLAQPIRVKTNHDQEDVAVRERLRHPIEELLQDGDSGIHQSRENGDRVPVPEREVRGAVHADHRGFSQEIVQH